MTVRPEPRADSGSKSFATAEQDTPMNNENLPQAGSRRQRLMADFGWTRSSYFLMSSFLATLLLLGYVWWPLAADYLALIDTSQPIWTQVDWLLISIFALMSLLIMAGADLKHDIWKLLVGLAGGLVIERWGTQTEAAVRHR